jgi:endothelin-converting enzyme/putative endopeptidase
MSRARNVPIVAASLALAAGLASGLTAPGGSAPRVPGPAPKGIEAGDVDRAADACTDFHAFANGAWRAANPIPAGAQRWSRRLAAREANREQLKALLGELAAKADRPRGSVEQLLGDHFAACMDEGSIDAAGVTPLAPLLAEIEGVRDEAGIERAIRRLHELAIPAPFVLTGASDYHDPARVIVNIAAGGLGLPDRDHYVGSEPRLVEARERYRAHVAAVLALGGMPAAAARKAAEDILALETRLAEASLAPAAAADAAATAHKVTFARLRAARFDWERYFAEAGLPRADLNVAEPAFLERLDRELESTPVEVWKAYLTWHLLESASPWLARPFAEESFAFKDKYLGGASEMKPRATRCLESTEALLGEPLGRKYAERYFPPAAKARVQEMVRELLAVLQEEVGGLAWMAPATRQQALAKLAAYEVKVGYPDVWADTSSLVIRRDAFWANVAAGRAFGVDANRRSVGRRAAREAWQLPPSSPDAYIDVQLNLMALPAGFLQAPAFDLAATDAANYGAIGIGVAHDLVHSIDALGADFDATGQPRSWWTEPDRQAFQQLGRCVVDQYEGYFIEPGVHHDGRRVLGEAIGDLAGVRVAYRALVRSMQRRPVPVVDGFSPEQQFFIAWGQYRGAAESIELQRQLVKADPHPVSKYRVIGPLSSSPEFQQAFACKAGSAMVRPPERRCAVW